MTKRRRVSRRPAPSGLAEISAGEQTRWSLYGPSIGDGPDQWPSWEAWAAVYTRCREAYLAERRARRAAQLANPRLAELMAGEPEPVPAAERIYQAMQRGEDPDAMQLQIGRELDANDPRDKLGR